MTDLVLDASAALAWCFEDEAGAVSLALLTEVRRSETFVPALFHMEVANVLTLAERRGRISEAKLSRGIDILGRLGLKVDETTWVRAFTAIHRLARSERLTVYDAAYLDLALRLDVPLATRDDALKQAAGRVGVSLFPA